MFTVFIIGAGQIGSRHLQALKAVSLPLDITVIDPSRESLVIAKKRYEEMPTGTHAHTVNYLRDISDGQNIDLAIIATTSSIRAKAIRNLLKKTRVHYFILEKLLFDKKSDYQRLKKTLNKLKIKTWVNCPMRIRPFYTKIKEALFNQKMAFRLTGGQWGLATNAIHYLDFVSYVTGNTDFTIDTSRLDKKIGPAKRKGFLELTGTLSADFSNGSHCELTNYPTGNAPWLIEIFHQDRRDLIQGLDGAWSSHAESQWKWKKRAFKTPLVSETTTTIVEDILKNGHCALTPYQESVKIHLALLEPLRLFLNKNSDKKYNYYPFT